MRQQKEEIVPDWVTDYWNNLTEVNDQEGEEAPLQDHYEYKDII